jgi:DNA-binding NarL/FixJ family response regulator
MSDHRSRRSSLITRRRLPDHRPMPSMSAHALSDPPPDGAACPTVLVVDADDRTRESMVGLLGIGQRFRVVGSAGHLALAVELAEAHHPDIVIVDPRLPEVSDGMTLIARLRAMGAAIRILAVGWSPSLEHQALAAGAHGFVRKTFRPSDLAAAVNRCLDGCVDEAGGEAAVR